MDKLRILDRLDKQSPSVEDIRRGLEKEKTKKTEDTADVRGQILSILTDANCKGAARNSKVARISVSALINRGRLYYHAERRDFDSAMFFDLDEKRLLRIRS